MDKVLQRIYNNEKFWNALHDLVQRKRRSERMERERRSHQVTSQTYADYIKNLYNDKVRSLIRLVLLASVWAMLWDLGGEIRCHYRSYNCKKCHDFEPQVFRFEQNGTTLTTACTSTYNGPLKDQPILQNITINLLHFAWMYVWMNECKEKMSQSFSSIKMTIWQWTLIT